MGNICRSPMAERILAHAVRAKLGEAAESFVHSESAGTGGWHAGESMNPPAARELRRRGAGDEGFRARKVLGAHLDTADLILTATAEQLQYVSGLRADAASRSFVLGEFGRLLGGIDADALPAADRTPEGVYARASAIVAAVDARRGPAGPLAADDLDDPWGRADAYFTEIADEVDATITPFVEMLLP
jgi:protein-tyrosine phosphatase